MKKLIVITVALVAIYLLLQNADPYNQAIAVMTEKFSTLWRSLTKGKVEDNVV